MAVLSGVKEMVDLCLAVIPNINAVDNLILYYFLCVMVFFFFFVNQTALHLACQQSSLEIVNLIVEDRAKVNIPNNIFFLIIIIQISNCFILI